MYSPPPLILARIDRKRTKVKSLKESWAFAHTTRLVNPKLAAGLLRVLSPAKNDEKKKEEKERERTAEPKRTFRSDGGGGTLIPWKIANKSLSLSFSPRSFFLHLASAYQFFPPPRAWNSTLPRFLPREIDATETFYRARFERLPQCVYVCVALSLSFSRVDLAKYFGEG